MAVKQKYRYNSNTKEYQMISDFSGGIDTISADSVLKDNVARNITNFNVKSGGILAKRQGIHGLDLKEKLVKLLWGKTEDIKKPNTGTETPKLHVDAADIKNEAYIAHLKELEDIRHITTHTFKSSGEEVISIFIKYLKNNILNAAIVNLIFDRGESEPRLTIFHLNGQKGLEGYDPSITTSQDKPIITQNGEITYLQITYSDTSNNGGNNVGVTGHSALFYWDGNNWGIEKLNDITLDNEAYHGALLKSNWLVATKSDLDTYNQDPNINFTQSIEVYRNEFEFDEDEKGQFKTYFSTQYNFEFLDPFSLYPDVVVATPKVPINLTQLDLNLDLQTTESITTTSTNSSDINLFKRAPLATSPDWVRQPERYFQDTSSGTSISTDVSNSNTIKNVMKTLLLQNATIPKKFITDAFMNKIVTYAKETWGNYGHGLSIRIAMKDILTPELLATFVPNNQGERFVSGSINRIQGFLVFTFTSPILSFPYTYNSLNFARIFELDIAFNYSIEKYITTLLVPDGFLIPNGNIAENTPTITPDLFDQVRKLDLLNYTNDSGTLLLPNNQAPDKAALLFKLRDIFEQRLGSFPLNIGIEVSESTRKKEFPNTDNNLSYEYTDATLVIEIPSKTTANQYDVRWEYPIALLNSQWKPIDNVTQYIVAPKKNGVDLDISINLKYSKITLTNLKKATISKPDPRTFSSLSYNLLNVLSQPNLSVIDSSNYTNFIDIPDTSPETLLTPVLVNRFRTVVGTELTYIAPVTGQNAAANYKFGYLFLTIEEWINLEKLSETTAEYIDTVVKPAFDNNSLNLASNTFKLNPKTIGQYILVVFATTKATDPNTITKLDQVQQVDINIEVSSVDGGIIDFNDIKQAFIKADKSISFKNQAFIYGNSNKIFVSDVNNLGYYPLLNTLTVPTAEPIINISIFFNALLVQTPTEQFLLKGDTPENFVLTPLNTNLGAIASFATKINENTIFSLTADGIYKTKSAYSFEDRLNVEKMDKQLTFGELSKGIALDPLATAIVIDSKYIIHTPSTKEIWIYYNSFNSWVRYSSELYNFSKLAFIQNKIYYIGNKGFNIFKDAPLITVNPATNLDEYQESYVDKDMYGQRFNITSVYASKEVDFGIPNHEKKWKRLDVGFEDTPMATDLLCIVKVDGMVRSDYHKEVITEDKINMTIKKEIITKPQITTHAQQLLGIGQLDIGYTDQDTNQIHSLQLGGRGKAVTFIMTHVDDKGVNIKNFALVIKNKKPKPLAKA